MREGAKGVVKTGGNGSLIRCFIIETQLTFDWCQHGQKILAWP